MREIDLKDFKGSCGSWCTVKDIAVTEVEKREVCFHRPQVEADTLEHY